MRFLFNRKKKDGEIVHQQPGLKDAIMDRITRVQRSWANWMQRKSDGLSNKSKWTVLVLFCIAGLSGSIYLLAGSLTKVPEIPIKVNRIKSPVHLEKTQRHKGAVSKTEYKKLVAFQVYMDSLARSPTGRNEYERIIVAHPGLMDSLETVKRFYQSQF